MDLDSNDEEHNDFTFAEAYRSSSNRSISTSSRQDLSQTARPASQSLSQLYRTPKHRYDDNDSDVDLVSSPRPSKNLFRATGRLGPPTFRPRSTLLVRRECSICADEQPTTNFAVENLTSSCTHEITACTTCITAHLETQIRDKPWDQITCIMCSAIVSFDSVRKFASADAFEE